MDSLRGRSTIALWIALAALTAPAGLDGQREPLVDVAAAPLRWEVGVDGIVAIPVGEFAEYVGLGGGGGLYGVLLVGRGQTLGIRLDVSLINYGSETSRVQLSPTIPFIEVDVSTQNQIASFGIGPQLQLVRGWFRPYGRASAGFSDFATTTSLNGFGDSDPIAQTTNFDDITFALVGAAGVRLMVSNGVYPIAIDVGGRYLRHGETEYLRRGGLTAGPGGEVLMETIRSETSLVGWHVGVSFALR